MRAQKTGPSRSLGLALHTIAILLVTVACMLPACTHIHRGPEEVTAALERHARANEGTADVYAKVVTASPPDVADAPTMRAPRTLSEFIRLALDQSPEIKAAELAAHAKAQRIAQVTSLPDPTVMTKTSPEPTRTAEGDNFFTLSISQKLPAPGKLDRAGRIALEQTRIALDRLHEVRLSVIAQVKRSYFGLHLLNKKIELLEADGDLMRSLIEAARAQFRVGKRSQADVLRGEVELSNLQAQLIELGHHRQASRIALNSLMNRPADTPIPNFEDFELRRAEYSAQDLFARAMESNPQLQRFHRRIELRRQELELARLASRPDFTLGFDWMSMEPRDAFVPPLNTATGVRPTVPQLSEDGSDNWAVRFGFTLPIWVAKIHAGVLEAQHNLSEAQQQYVAARNRIERTYFDALHRFRAQKELALLFRDSIIPQAEQTYRVSLSSYSAGTTDFLDIIEDHRRWLTLTIRYHQALSDLEISVADLEQAIGRSLAEMDESD